jgi:hypothetical protein
MGGCWGRLICSGTGAGDVGSHFFASGFLMMGREDATAIGPCKKMSLLLFLGIIACPYTILNSGTIRKGCLLAVSCKLGFTFLRYPEGQNAGVLSMVFTAGFEMLCKCSRSAFLTWPAPYSGWQLGPGPCHVSRSSLVSCIPQIDGGSFSHELILGYQNVCSGKTNFLVFFGSNLLPNEEFNFPVALSPGIYKFFLADAYGNGKALPSWLSCMFTCQISFLQIMTRTRCYTHTTWLLLWLSSSPGIVRYGGGTWSIVAAGNIILYQNDGFIGGVVDTTGIIIVGNELVCPNVSLPGSTAHVIVTLFTDDSFPEETSLGYQNLCNNIETTMLEYNRGSQCFSDIALSQSCNLQKLQLLTRQKTIG